MVIGQFLGSDHSVHIGFHELLNEIYLVEGLIVSGFLDIENTNDVLVVEVSKQLHFSEGTQTKHAVVEGGNLLDGDLLAGWFVKSRAVVIVSATSSCRDDYSERLTRPLRMRLHQSHLECHIGLTH